MRIFRCICRKEDPFLYFCVGLIEEVSGKEKKFQWQYFDVCTSSTNKIGVTGQTGQRCHLAMQICQ